MQSQSTLTLYSKSLPYNTLETLIQTLDPNQNNKGYNALHAATEFLVDTEKRFRLLIKAGTDVNSKDMLGPFHNTPLHVLIANECHDESLFFMREIKNLGKTLDYNALDFEKKTPLLLSIKTRQSDIALFIINQKTQGENINLNLADQAGKRPIDYACLLGMTEVVQALVSAGVNIHSANSLMRKPLDYTASDATVITQTLDSVSIDATRDENARFNEIRDSLLQPLLGLEYLKTKNFPTYKSVLESKNQVLAVLEAGIIDMKALADNRLEPLEDENEYKTILAQFDQMTGKPLLDKCIKGQQEVRKMLIKQGAHFDWLIRFYATGGNNEELSPLLALPEAKDHIDTSGMPSGKNALHQATLKGKNKTCELLIEAKANINFRDKEDNTALHLAVIEKKIDIVKLLVSLGANKEIPNKKGQTVNDLLNLPEYAEINQTLEIKKEERTQQNKL